MDFLPVIAPLTLGGIILFLARKAGFFKKTLCKECPNISILRFLFIFIPFFAIQILSFQVALFFLSSGEGSFAEKGWAQVISIVVSALFLYRVTPKEVYHYGPLKRAATFTRGALSWFIIVPFVVAISNLGSIILKDFLNIAPVDQDPIKYLKMLTSNPPLLYSTVFLIVTLIPYCEETLFRGLLQNCLKKYFPSWGAILGTSLVFTSLHYSSNQGFSNLEILPPLFILSCFLGYIYEKYRSLFASVALHSLFNLVNTIILLF